MSARKSVGITPGSDVTMSDTELLPSTAQASADVEKLQRTYDSLIATWPEDHEVVKACRKSLDVAQAKSNAQAQLVDQKHVTKALIQTHKFEASTTEAFEKGNKLEQARLADLEKAVEEQKAFMAQRAVECSLFLKSILTVVTQLEALSTHLMTRGAQAEGQEKEKEEPTAVLPAPAASTPPAPDALKLNAFHDLLTSSNIQAEVAQRIRESAAAAYAPSSPSVNSYGKADIGGPAAHAARAGPYQEGENSARVDAHKPE